MECLSLREPETFAWATCTSKNASKIENLLPRETLCPKNFGSPSVHNESPERRGNSLFMFELGKLWFEFCASFFLLTSSLLPLLWKGKEFNCHCYVNGTSESSREWCQKRRRTRKTWAELERRKNATKIRLFRSAFSEQEKTWIFFLFLACLHSLAWCLTWTNIHNQARMFARGEQLKNISCLSFCCVWVNSLSNWFSCFFPSEFDHFLSHSIQELCLWKERKKMKINNFARFFHWKYWAEIAGKKIVQTRSSSKKTGQILDREN